MKAIFECKSEFGISVGKLFSFHEEPIGFQTLVGLDKNVKVIEAPKNILVGAKAVIEVQILPFIKKNWVAKHTGYEKNQFFIDEQEEGPFLSFKHTHQFEPKGEKSILTDHIEFEFYFSFISKYFVVEKLKSQFRARHLATAKALNTKSEFIFVGLI
jgi:ligand-binding SRPBCC domain-containing protein